MLTEDGSILIEEWSVDIGSGVSSLTLSRLILPLTKKKKKKQAHWDCIRPGRVRFDQWRYFYCPP